MSANKVNSYFYKKNHIPVEFLKYTIKYLKYISIKKKYEEDTHIYGYGFRYILTYASCADKYNHCDR